MSKNSLEADTQATNDNTVRHMRVACRISNATRVYGHAHAHALGHQPPIHAHAFIKASARAHTHTHTNTHTEKYLIPFSFSTAIIISRRRLNVTSCVHCVCC
jgi:hypothetical protein